MKLLQRIGQDKLSALCLLTISAVLIAGLMAPLLAPHDPEEVHMELRYAASSSEYWLGNDHLGRCMLSRLIYGIRPSVLAVMAALFVSAGIGSIAGLLAGYFRGMTDAVLMRLCDVTLSFPGYVMTLAIIGILGIGLENILIAFVLIKWAWFARIIRSTVMQLADAEYVQFAKAIGVRNRTIIVKHIIPVSLPDIAVAASSSFGSMILQISGFSFLGIGVQAPSPEWGMMLNEARAVMFSKPELMLAPGIAIVLVVSAVNYLSDSLQIALDPKLTASRRTRYEEQRKAAAARLQRKEVV